MVRMTSRSIMKKPVISCVRVGRWVRFRGEGRIRSDWACWGVGQCGSQNQDGSLDRVNLNFEGVPFCRLGMISGVPRVSRGRYRYVYIGIKV